MIHVLAGQLGKMRVKHFTNVSYYIRLGAHFILLCLNHFACSLTDIAISFEPPSFYSLYFMEFDQCFLNILPPGVGF